jgi:hypothetical protein
LQKPAHPSIELIRHYVRVYGDEALPYFITPEDYQISVEAYETDIQRELDFIQLCRLPASGVLTIRQPSNPSVQAAKSLGIEVLDAYTPNNPATLGAPTFPFYVSETDFRRPGKAGPGVPIGNTLDFVGSYHFHAPIDWHMIASRKSWHLAKEHMDLAVREVVLNARNSGVHFFLTTLVLFDRKWIGRSLKAHPQFARIDPPSEEENWEWVLNWFNETGFVLPKKYPVIFARLSDYADYFRRHYKIMPTRIVSYVTHDPDYDRYWTNEWNLWGKTGFEKGETFDAAIHAPIPLFQDLETFRRTRQYPQTGAPKSTEYIWFQSQAFQCRLEKACVKPLRYYRFTDVHPVNQIGMPELAIPDPKLEMTTRTTEEQFEVLFEITEGEEFENYMLAVWDVPREFASATPKTNANQVWIVENTDGDFRAVLLFDLQPAMRVWLRLLRTTS